MFRIGIAAMMIAFAGLGAFAQDAAPVQLETYEARLSYVLGAQIGEQLKMTEADIDIAVFMRAVEDAMEEKEPAISPEEITEIMARFQTETMQRMERQRADEGQKNLLEGAAFLEAKRAEDNVQETESGLLYEVLEPGTGESPTLDDVVQVHYSLESIDGNVIDSSIERGEPVDFPVSGRMIEGWTEGLSMMQEGAKWRLYVPSHLAYGADGFGAIGPNAALVFTIELLDIIEGFNGMQGMPPHPDQH